jgi:hypothetical protein
MRSYRWRPQAPRAAAPAAPRAALLGSVWLGALAAFAPNAAQATDGTWIGGGAPVSNEWTQGNNWNSTPTPNTVPDDIATFTNNPGAPTLVTISSSTSSSTSINTIQFTAAAPAYSFTINPFATFSINGAGIANSSAFAPGFTNNFFMFFNSGTAANAAITNNGSISFLGSSSAGSSTIINNGFGSLISFSDTAPPAMRPSPPTAALSRNSRQTATAATPASLPMPAAPSTSPARPARFRTVRSRPARSRARARISWAPTGSSSAATIFRPR